MLSAYWAQVTPTFLWFQSTLTEGFPRRKSLWSMTSSWISDAEWIISLIMATCLCDGSSALRTKRTHITSLSSYRLIEPKNNYEGPYVLLRKRRNKFAVKYKADQSLSNSIISLIMATCLCLCDGRRALRTKRTLITSLSSYQPIADMITYVGHTTA